MKPYYEHAGITIYHGDCREIAPCLEPCDLMLTDPPYGLNLSNDLWLYQRGRIEKSDWDREPFKDLTCLLPNARASIVWGGNFYKLPLSRGWLSWFKPDAVPTMSHFELAWTSFNMVTRQFRYCIAETNGERVGHPTQKPLALMHWCLTFSPDAQTVLDPFAGSGTTLVAAKNQGISAIGIEIEERYCEIAAKRLSQEVFNFEVSA